MHSNEFILYAYINTFLMLKLIEKYSRMYAKIL